MGFDKKNIGAGRVLSQLLYAGVALFLFSGTGQAQTFPSSIDAGRVEEPKEIYKPIAPEKIIVEPRPVDITLPAEAESIRFTLKDINISGASLAEQADFRKIYQSKIGQDIALAEIWDIAQKLTDYYRAKGYFLSRAYIPEQEIDQGVVQINIVEGYVAQIEMDSHFANQMIIEEMVENLMAQKPLKISELESFLLRLNNLGGYEFHGLLKALPTGPEGAVQLILTDKKKQPDYQISIDNYGSRYLGPYQFFATAQAGLSLRHMGSLSVGGDVKIDEMKYVATRHELSVTDHLKINLSASHVRTEPGSSLRVDEIKSESSFLSVGLSYQPIRQRFENLIFSFDIDGRNSDGDFLVNNPLTRDRVRAARLGVDYDVADSFKGYNFMQARLNRGIDIAGRSDKGAANLSRAEAEPDFFYLSASYVRQQILSPSVALVAQLSGQYSAHPLFSSEEFGFGGANMGRAYDSSEILGDSGVATQIEARYTGFNMGEMQSLTPYIYYDIGKVWNKDSNAGHVSAASAGFGGRYQHQNGFSAHAGVAFPLTKDADKPLYGNKKSPRFLLRSAYSF